MNIDASIVLTSLATDGDYSAVSKHLKYRSCAYDETAYDFGMAEKVFVTRIY